MLHTSPRKHKEGIKVVIYETGTLRNMPGVNNIQQILDSQGFCLKNTAKQNEG